MYVCVCIYSLLSAHNVHSSHLETLIKCYYQHKHFHLLSFYYATFASVYIYVCVSARVVRMHACVCVPYAVGQIKCSGAVLSGVRNALQAADDTKRPLRKRRTHPGSNVAIFDQTHFAFRVGSESMN